MILDHKFLDEKSDGAPNDRDTSYCEFIRADGSVCGEEEDEHIKEFEGTCPRDKEHVQTTAEPFCDVCKAPLDMGRRDPVLDDD